MKLPLLAVAATGLLAAPLGAANLLVNGDFETGDLGGWTINNGSVATPTVGAQSGANAALLTIPGGGGVPEINQIFPANPGDEFNLSGWLLTEATIPAGPSFGLFKIVFKDSGGVDLPPASVSSGQFGPPANPGAESLPFLDNASAVDTWIFSETQAVAPAGTTQVQFLALNVDFAGGENPIFVDNVSAELVPEPGVVLLGSFGLLGLLVRRRR